MDMKRMIIGTIIGAAAWDFVNYLFVGVLLADFYAANLGSATGVFRDETLQWAVFLGCLPLGALISFCIASREEVPTIGGGFATGFVISLVVWFHADFVFYGFTNVFNLTLSIVDSALSAIFGGIAGAIVAVVLARIPKTAMA